MSVRRHRREPLVPFRGTIILNTTSNGDTLRGRASGLPWLALAVAVSVATVRLVAGGAAGATFVRETPWWDHGTWLKVDTHVHTTFSDGGKDIDTILSRAVRAGCDAIGITDHADRNLTAATPAYLAAIERARATHSQTVILGGVEWNPPPHGGQAHVVVLTPPAAERALAIFKNEFDDLGRSSHGDQLALEGLRWLREAATIDGLSPVAIYEHPSREAKSAEEIVRDVRAWRSANDVLVGIAGAPGHQGTKPVGSYNGRLTTVDRWDPVVQPGNAWDTLLNDGIDVWGAYAPSDFHTDNLAGLADYWPCEFSETWLYAPERTPAGVLRALRAGSFFGDHGRIVREVDLRVNADGLPRPAHVGEAIEVDANTTVTAEMSFVVPERAWRPGTNRIDRVELIAIDRGGVRVVWRGEPQSAATAFSEQVTVGAGGVVLRARGFHVLETGTQLAFYTNPVRVIARSAAGQP